MRLMKILPLLALLIVSAVASDRVTITGFSGTCQAPCEARYTINIENSDTIKLTEMGFRIQASDYVTYDIVEISVKPGSRFDGSLPWTIFYDSEEPIDTFMIFGGPAAPGTYNGVPPGPLQAAFEIVLDISNVDYQSLFFTEGTLLIDSCTVVPPAYHWTWGYTQPAFANKWSYFEYCPCGYVSFITVPENDQIIANHCDGAQFQFIAQNWLPETIIMSYRICFDPPPGSEITNSGLFTFYPEDTGIFYFTLEAWDDCPISGNYDFRVIMTNAGQEFQNCPGQAISRFYGSNVIYDLGLVNHDCDTLNETITTLSGPAAQPANPPSINNGIITWQTTADDIGVWLFEVANEDPYNETAVCQIAINITAESADCGDANSDGTVDVSDAVHLINYIFVGGFAPEPLERGNVNCDLVVDVSDAVWIINYVFVGGAAPCEC